jgi:hypothetical protein
MKVNPAPFVDNIFITSPLTKGEVGKSTKGAGSTLERVRGVEPLSTAWKAVVIPIYDTRLISYISTIY